MFAQAIFVLLSASTLVASMQILSLNLFEECEGKDASNYTLIQQLTRNAKSELEEVDGQVELIQSGPNGQRAVNLLKELSSSYYPAGAYDLDETLWVATSGPLQGKYLYLKKQILKDNYLKKLSSTLGYSYVSSKSDVLLINERLDLNVLLSPTGAFEVFKKGCTTACTGRGYDI